jgi:hypothetical protein
MSERKPAGRRLCPVCRGTGLDPLFNHRFTSGGRDDRTCGRCHGECFDDLLDDEPRPQTKQASHPEPRQGDSE